MEWIQDRIGMAVESQILMTSLGQLLRADSQIDQHLTDDIHGHVVIYVYDRRLLDTSYTEDDSDEASCSSTPLSSSISDNGSIWQRLNNMKQMEAPLMDLRLAYLNVFEANQQQAASYLVRIQQNQGQCTTLVDAARRQVDALHVALKNLQMHCHVVVESWTTFDKMSAKEFDHFDDLMSQFENDLAALAHVPVHPALRHGDNSVMRLLDWVDVRSYRQNMAQAQREYGLLKKEKASLQASTRSLQVGSDREIQRPVDVDFRELDKSISDATSIVKRSSEIHDKIAADLKEAQAVVQRSFASAQPRLDKLLKQHLADLLPELSRSDAALRNAVAFLIENHRRLRSAFISRLRLISQHQSSIVQIKPQLEEVKQCFEHVKQLFSEFLVLHRMPAAFGAAMAEIVRRKSFMMLYSKKVTDIADALSRLHDNEVKRRGSFQHEITPYLPPGMLDALTDLPPLCEVTASNLTDRLPNLSKQDLQEFQQTVKNVQDKKNMRRSSTPSNVLKQSDSLSKLAATMICVSSQIDGTELDFDRVLQRSRMLHYMLVVV